MLKNLFAKSRKTQLVVNSDPGQSVAMPTIKPKKARSSIIFGMMVVLAALIMTPFASVLPGFSNSAQAQRHRTRRSRRTRKRRRNRSRHRTRRSLAWGWFWNGFSWGQPRARRRRRRAPPRRRTRRRRRRR